MTDTNELSVQEILRRLYVPSEHALRADGSSATAVYGEYSAQFILNDVYDEATNTLRFV